MLVVVSVVRLDASGCEDGCEWLGWLMYLQQSVTRMHVHLLFDSVPRSS